MGMVVKNDRNVKLTGSFHQKCYLIPLSYYKIMYVGIGYLLYYYRKVYQYKSYLLGINYYTQCNFTKNGNLMVIEKMVVDFVTVINSMIHYQLQINDFILQTTTDTP